MSTKKLSKREAEEIMGNMAADESGVLADEQERELNAGFKVLELHARLDQIKLEDIPVMSSDRHIARKDQAALARKLFRSLTLKGLSVTSPSYSMASSVHIKLPAREDYQRDEHGQRVDRETDPASIANHTARTKLEAILNKAFPNHNDRSDTQSDYFDFCWSICH